MDKKILQSFMLYRKYQGNWKVERNIDTENVNKSSKQKNIKITSIITNYELFENEDKARNLKINYYHN